jgi:hypothetical protein
MNLNELKATYGEDILNLWAIHFAFIQLGFDTADIYLLFTEGPSLAVQLHAQGKTFTVTCGKMPCTQEDFTRRWGTFVELQNAHTADETLEEFWEQSVMRETITLFTANLLAKGFRLPCNQPGN